MSYFSSKSTWLSLVDMAEAGGSASARSEIPSPDAEGTGIHEPMLDGISLSFEDFRPVFPALDPDAGTQAQAGDAPFPSPISQEDLDYMRITRDLRHRLFFHFKEWEFGPALLEDHIRLAQSESDPEEALANYCHARHVAVTLVNRNSQINYLLAWLEADRVIAEIHNLLGNYESCALYAKEGLDTIKKNKFPATLDMRITKLTIGFFNLLGRK